MKYYFPGQTVYYLPPPQLPPPPSAGDPIQGPGVGNLPGMHAASVFSLQHLVGGGTRWYMNTSVYMEAEVNWRVSSFFKGYFMHSVWNMQGWIARSTCTVLKKEEFKCDYKL